MYQISCQSDELCRKKKGRGSDWPPPVKASCNYFFFDASKIKREELINSAMMYTY